MTLDIGACSLFCQTASFWLVTHPILCFSLNEVKFFHCKDRHVSVNWTCVGTWIQIRIIGSLVRCTGTDIVLQPTEFYNWRRVGCRSRTRTRLAKKNSTRVVSITTEVYKTSWLHVVCLVEYTEAVFHQEFWRNSVCQQVSTWFPCIDNRLSVAPRRVLLHCTAIEIVTRFAAKECSVHRVSLPDFNCLTCSIVDSLTSFWWSVHVRNITEKDTSLHSINQTFPLVQVTGIHTVLLDSDILVTRSLCISRIFEILN